MLLIASKLIKMNLEESMPDMSFKAFGIHGYKLIPSWSMPRDGLMLQEGNDNTVVCSYDFFIAILCMPEINQTKKLRPYETIFNYFGFNEKSEKIAFYYANGIIDESIDRAHARAQNKMSLHDALKSAGDPWRFNAILPI